MAEILNEQETADYLRLTHPSAKQTIQRMARSGVLRGNKVGREWRFHIKAIESFLLTNQGRRV